MSNITTVIFDMYETLAHNNPGLWLESFHRICAAQDLKVDPEELWKQWRALDVKFRKERLNLQEPEKSPPFKSYEEAWRDSFVGAFRQLGLDGDAAAAARAAVEDMGSREPYADVAQVMPQLQARWRTAIMSNSDNDYLGPTLERLGFRFEAVLSSETARAYKPHPAPFRRIMEMLAVTAEECVYVGDSQLDDVMGAQRVGMKTVWLNRKGTPPAPELPAPDHQIRELAELPPILER